MKDDVTFRPKNYATYAQLSDFPASNPYAPRLPGHRRDLHYVTRLVSATATHAEPNPSFALLLGSSNPNKFLRDPTYEEELLMVSYALSAGAKGIGYYWWPRLHCNAELVRGLADINARLRQVGSLVVNSIPTGWSDVSTDDGEASTEALWAVGQGMVVPVTNEEYTTDPYEGGTTKINAPSNVRLSCRLPEEANDWKLFRVAL